MGLTGYQVKMNVELISSGINLVTIRFTSKFLFSDWENKGVSQSRADG